MRNEKNNTKQQTKECLQANAVELLLSELVECVEEGRVGIAQAVLEAVGDWHAAAAQLADDEVDEIQTSQPVLGTTE